MNFPTKLLTDRTSVIKFEKRNRWMFHKTLLYKPNPDNYEQNQTIQFLLNKNTLCSNYTNFDFVTKLLESSKRAVDKLPHVCAFFC